MANPDLTVLIVEADALSRKSLSRDLAGHARSFEAESGQQALTWLSENRADCVLLDYRLPDGGAELLKQLIALGLPVVLVAGGGDENAAAEALELGAMDYLPKHKLQAESLKRSVRYAVERSKSEARLRSAERRYRNLFEDAPLMYVVTKRAGGREIIVDCNKLFQQTLGYSRAEILHRPLIEFISEENEAWLRAAVLDEGSQLECQAEECHLLSRGGDVIPTLLTAVADLGAENRPCGGRAMFVDISKRRRAENALKDNEGMHRDLLDAIPDMMMRIRRVSGKLTFDPPRERPQLDLEAQSPVEAGHRVLPIPVVREFERAFELARQGVVSTLHYELETAGTVHHLEARLVRSGPSEVLAIIRDLTAQKELERQLQQSQRLEAVGRLAGGVAHDFNNLLTVIAGNTELALADLKPDDPNMPGLREIVEAAGRATDLTRQLLAFSRKQILKPRVLDLNRLISELEKMLRRLIGEDIVIRLRLQSELGPIKADPGQMEQVLMNLAVNARDAMPDGGILTFQTEKWDITETYTGYEVRIPPGRYIRLLVSDTGHGMDEDTRAHIFEPFFTTKEKGKGTGLGLSTVYGIVKQSGGYIWVYSEVNQGTVFKIYLPRHDAREIDQPEQMVPVLARGSGQTVLLVEDDAKVLNLARSILRRGGYNVITARDGQSAIRIVKEYPGTIDLVATDVVMPGMSGRHLADSLEPLRPGLKVLYMSGYTDDSILHHGVLQPGTHFLEKPYSRAELLEAVRRALGSEATPRGPSSPEEDVT